MVMTGVQVPTAGLNSRTIPRDEPIPSCPVSVKRMIFRSGLRSEASAGRRGGMRLRTTGQRDWGPH
jgi:hypothetical protein